MILEFIFKRQRKKNQKEIKSTSNIYGWMDLSKEERLEIDSKQKDESMKKKKELLKSIRKEYIKLKNNKK